MKRRMTFAALWAAITISLLAAGCELTGGPARHAILLAVLDHPQYHVQDAQYWKESAEEQTNWRGLFIIHEDGQSKLYWGEYASLNKARKRLAKARRFRTLPSEESPNGDLVFGTAKIVPAPGIDMGPPEWMLANDTEDLRWTLVVAEFHSGPGYKEPEKYAVEYCRQLREEGRQAFLHHTPAKSYVTLGNFPESSYQMTTTRNTTREWANRGMALPTIPDKRLRDLVRSYPELATNGRRSIVHEINPITGRMEEFPDPSFMMDISPARGVHGD